MGENRMAGTEDWEIVKAVNPEKGQAQVFRLRKTKPHGTHVRSLLTALSIRWSYDPASVFPKGEEKEAILKFERATDRLTEENGHSELVLVATGMGVKEWLYYVDDPSLFMATLKDVLGGEEPYPISVEWYEDPQWNLWRQTVDAVDERAGT